MKVLLIEEGWHSTLELAAALERSKFAVTVLTANGSTARIRHRSVEWTSGPALASPGFVAELHRLAADADHVLPLTEAAMVRAWACDVPRVWPPTEPWQRALVASKHATTAFLRAHGIPVPAQTALAPELATPIVVKGDTGSGGRRVRIARTREQLVAAIARSRELGGSWLAEEYLPGPTFLAGGLFADGTPLRLYACEKLEQHPADIGGAIAVRSTADPELIALATAALRAIRWTGFASIDAMRDSTGRFVVLEVNPRLWGSFAGAADAGVELFAPFGELLAGRALCPELGFAQGVVTTIFPRYLNSATHRSIDGARRAVRDWLGPQGREWRDPRFVLHTLHRLRRMRANHERI